MPLAGEILDVQFRDCEPASHPRELRVAAGHTHHALMSAPRANASDFTNLPTRSSPLLGRTTELNVLAEVVAEHRLVTLTGPAGIGKTQLGIEVARRLRHSFADGVWFAELAPLHAPDLVPFTIATALRLDLTRNEAMAKRVADALRAKRLLLLVDNSQQAPHSVAHVAEAVLHVNPGARVIAISREPLRAHGECAYRVPPLDVPREDAGEAAELLRYGGTRLFVERARAAEPSFSPDRETAATIAAICRRLDGMPFAIELAAARAATLGVQELAARLDNRLSPLTLGYGTVLPRRQIVRATLDWSYELLPSSERAVLRRLAMFAADFSLEDACAVARCEEIDASQVVICMANLVSKSLVAAELDGQPARYRLLETTRTYALEKLFAEAKSTQQHAVRACSR